jgi:phosphatidylinositol-3,4,5-trisphosphate 3-phosphatase/dual-specificity protein phosphatase PTEN
MDKQPYKHIKKGYSENFNSLLKTFETGQQPDKKPKSEKGDLKTQILHRFPKLTEEQFKIFLMIKDDTEKAVSLTVKNKGTTGVIKSLVSKAKSRFVYDGFDLDLTYITPRIIAMGFPSTSLEGLYRNNMEDVKRFFATRHKDSYKVYNLCGEKTYPKDTFYKQSYYPFPDHEAPPLNLLVPFCKDAKAFLDENEKNVVAIHCKAGKGRTGTFICALLIYLNLFKKADEALAYYGIMRVGDGRGVTIPSQIRYVKYFEEILDKKMDMNIKPKKIIIRRIKLSNAPGFGKVSWNSSLTFSIDNGENNSYKYYDYIKKRETFNLTMGEIDFYLGVKGFEVSGDVKITFFNVGMIGSRDKIFKFWIHTQFLPEGNKFCLTKNEIDKACKDTTNKNFKEDFKVEVYYFDV